jgi:hypothetical protein
MQFLLRPRRPAYRPWHEALTGLVHVSDIKVNADRRAERRADRTAPDALPRLPRRGAVVSRHGAISRELTKYASYKSWADKARSAFAADAAEAPAANGSGHMRRSTDR